ncbi:E3 ubiquitin-protein ligase TTC3 [Pipra filicauda]|uniref:RING-type E3 ubiquitin transferase n=1 Tax=Pipra filicauda TaxID=649802 RepID=A0A7R5KPK8_9PASS|nr:E3 ubiquitin-protein ligase TTC3 [Pipra filicauda]
MKDEDGSCAMADPSSTSDLATLALCHVDRSYLELGHGTFGQTVLPNPKTGVNPCEVWCNQPVERLREHCNVIKIQMLWPLLFTQESISFQEEFGLLFQGWRLWKTMSECNFVEDLADLIKKVVNIPHFISGILRIGNGIENGFFDIEEAVDWIRCVGDANVLQGLEELRDFRRLKLATVFTQWERSIVKVALEDCDLVEELKAQTCESSRKESEFMKQRGNEVFSRGAFVPAIISYTRAIELCRTNHFLYGNRALCFILTGDYERAVVDGKRATVLKPDWPKGHHHYCKALALLGRHEQALEANERAQELCRDVPDGLKELVQQHHRLKRTLEEISGTKQRKQKAKKSLLEKKDCSSSKSHRVTSQEQKELEKIRKRTQADPKGPQKHDPKMTDTQRPESKVSTLELPQNQSHQNKRKQKPKPGDSEKMRDHLELKRESKAMEDKGLCAVPQMDFNTEDVKNPRNKGFTASLEECPSDKPILLPTLRALGAAEREVFQVDFNALPEGVTSLARDGCTALMDQQCHSAEQAFSQLLSILYTSEFRCLNIHKINYTIIIYGHATALLGIGQPEALAKAEDQFKKIIEEYPEERCFCLAHYGIGRVYLRQNRFAHALDQFLRSKLMIDLKIVPGVLTWPATTRVIEETQTESLQMALRNCIEQCKFPPEPDAVCRYQQCHGHSKIQIFFTDPDFKGFIRVICCQQCRVEFHMSCWKKLKTTSYSDKNDKDFLKELCFTPDCKGLISKIIIFSSSGAVKCEFELKITKPKGPPRASIKQKCSSVNKKPLYNVVPSVIDARPFDITEFLGQSILVLSSGVSTAPREEEKIFIEENNLYTDFTNEPFLIPEYLQKQLEEFEALYEVSNSNSYNNPDPISESLYEYFTQILDEHGPLEINNKLLVGEYENFPEETRKVVEDQGGLESFLLKSLRFIMVDNLICLKKHSVFFEGNTNRSENYIDGNVQGNHSQKNLRLNPDAEEFKPQSYPVQPHIPPSPDLSYETLQYLPYSFPASWRSRNSLQSQSIDSMENKSSFADVLLKNLDSTSPIFLPQTSWGYQYGRILPVPSPVPVLPHVARQPGYIYADPAAPQDNQESAIPVRKYVRDNFIPTEIQTCEDPCGQLENSDKENLAAPGSSDEAENGKQVIKVEKGSKSKPGMKSNPHIRMVAVQVNQEVADRETNTLPFHPFENQQGDILRVEKEHQVLKEQLKEAEEKFEQLQSRSSEEISALEELLRKSVEETEVSQNELDWFHQDSEAQGKKWQQEKKENRDNLKALRSTAKKHTDTNERYLKTIDDKEKQYNVYLNTFLDTSNKFANEKVKLEELIKKSQDDCQECVKRAVKAEISVFQNWKESEVWKLSGTVAKAEANLKMLKTLSSSSASAAPLLKAQIDSWETFISNVKKQLEKVEAEYEEKIELVKSGAQISLTKVEIMDIPSPPSVLTIPARPLVSDPAIVTYSLASAHPSSLPAFSSPEGQGPTQPSLQTQAGAKAAHATTEASSASGGSMKTHPQPPEGSYSNKLPSPHPSGISGSATQPTQNHQDASALQPRPPALPNNKKLPKALENIIARLQSIFPNYSSSDFTGFIREVQRRNGNTLSGLSSDEVLNRVTELILDQQSQAPTSAGRVSAPPAPTGTRSREAGAEGNAPSPSRAGPAPKNTSNKNPRQPNLQPWGNVGAIPKAKWKKQDNAASSEDPCTICHDELSKDSCELECGHHFHRECIRTWLKEHSSTCPICRVHALLPEDFPELPAWNKCT